MFETIKISVFRNAFDTAPVDVFLSQFLNSKKHVERIEAIRAESSKEKRTELKKLLPCATISGTFQKRNLQGIKEYNGLICLDFDGADNPNVSPAEMKKILKGFNEIAFAGLSVSGAGIWAILKSNLTDITEHSQIFDLLKLIFEQVGLKLDIGCRDATRLRFVSYDSDPYINPNPQTWNAKQYIKPLKEQIQVPKKREYTAPKREQSGTQAQSSVTPTRTRERVEILIEKIEAGRVDITENYYDWYRLAFAFYDEFKHDGLDYFLRISQFNSGFDQNKATQKFNEIAQKACGNIKISTFFSICKSFNLTTI